MIQFLVHEKDDSVGVATVDIKAEETAEGLYMDTQEKIQIKTNHDVPLGHKVALKAHAVDEGVISTATTSDGSLRISRREIMCIFTI